MRSVNIPFRFRRRLKVYGGLALALTLLAACGASPSPGNDDSEATKGSVELQQVNVGVLPITSIAPLQIGIDKGYFKEEGLEVHLHPAQGGAALVPAVASGQYDFAFSNNASLMLAKAKGLQLSIVAAANSAGSEPDPLDEALVVPANSPVKSVADLAGKTIAVNALNNIVEIADRAALEAAGVDPSTVKFLEVGFPDMPLALEQGRVDAADVAEPFLTKAKQAGATVIAYPFRSLQAKDFNISSWFTSDALISSNPEMVEKFTRALDKSNAYANEHIEEVRALLPDLLKIDPELAKEIYVAPWPNGLTSAETLNTVHKALIANGLLKKEDLPDGTVLLHKK